MMDYLNTMGKMIEFHGQNKVKAYGENKMMTVVIVKKLVL